MKISRAFLFHSPTCKHEMKRKWQPEEERNSCSVVLNNPDLLNVILGHVSQYTLRAVVLVSKQWNKTVKDSHNVSMRHILGFLRQESFPLTYLQWLLKHGCTLEPETIEREATFGNLENVKFLDGTGCPMGKNTLRNVASNGYLEIMKWLVDHGCSIEPGVMASAAKHGNLENVIWLHENRKKSLKSPYAFEYAVRGGHLNVMEWLYEKKYPYINLTLVEAAKCENLKIMKWLYEKGCRMTSAVFNCAIERENLEILEWLHEKKCPCNHWSFDIIGRKLFSVQGEIRPHMYVCDAKALFISHDDEIPNNAMWTWLIDNNYVIRKERK